MKKNFCNWPAVCLILVVLLVCVGCQPSDDSAVRIATTGDGTYKVQTQLLRTIPYMANPAPGGHYVVE